MANKLNFRSKKDFLVILATSCLIFISFVLVNKTSQNTTKNAKAYIEDGCVISGCNMEVCQDKTSESIASICIYKPEYECYKSARCEKQLDGKCGWTSNNDLQSCLTKTQDDF